MNNNNNKRRKKKTNKTKAEIYTNVSNFCIDIKHTHTLSTFGNELSAALNAW